MILASAPAAMVARTNKGAPARRSNVPLPIALGNAVRIVASKGVAAGRRS